MLLPPIDDELDLLIREIRVVHQGLEGSPVERETAHDRMGIDAKPPLNPRRQTVDFGELMYGHKAAQPLAVAHDGTSVAAADARDALQREGVGCVGVEHGTERQLHRTQSEQTVEVGLPGSAGGKALRLFGGPDGTLRLIGRFAVSFRLRTGFALGLPFVALCLRLLGGLERVGPHSGFKDRHLLSFSLGERKVGDTFVRGRRPKPPDSGQDDEDHQQHKKAITKFAGEGRENTSHKSLNCQSFVKQV